MAQEDPQLLNVKKAAAFLGLNPSTIRQWAISKKLKGVKVGSRGDWRFTKDELAKMIHIEEKKFSVIKKFLRENAVQIQELAYQNHIVHLGRDNIRRSFIEKNKDDYITIVKELADNLDNLKKGTITFERLAERIAKRSVENNLTIEEAVDGTIFLKQAFWQKLDKAGFLNTLTTKDFYAFSHIITTYSDIVAAKIAFAYHDYFSKSEEKNKKIQERFDLAVSSSNIGIYEWDINTNEIVWTRELEMLYGLPARKILRSYAEIAKANHPDDAKKTEIAVKKAIKEKRILDIEYRILWPDKTIHWLSAKGKTYYDAKGKPIKMIGAVTDVTDQRRTEKALQDSENRLKRVLETEAVGILFFDYDGNVVDANDVFLQLTGYKRSQIEKGELHWRTMTPPEWVKESEAQMKRFARTGRIGPYEKEYYFADGSRCWMLFAGRDLGDGTIVEFCVDISPLKQSEERFRAVWESVSDAMAISDENGIVIAANPGYSELYGYPLNKIVGKDFSIIFPKSQRAAAQEQYKKMFKGDRITATIETKIQRADKSERIVESLYDFITQNKKRVAMISTIRDITERKSLERQKDDFLGVASHELKTPVTSIKAYTQVLQMLFQRKGDSIAVEQLSKMDSQINKLSNLIEDLLDVTKIQAGKIQFNKEDFEFNALVKETVEELQRTTEKHKIVMQLGKTKILHGDRDRVEQVLINLLSNAIKYSPNADKIVVKTTLEKATITLSVQDFGVGISKDKHENLFKQFYRVSGPSQNTFPGLGLGLYISSEIIKRQGGKIWVESAKGKGSIFYFSLPTNKK